MLLHRHLEIRRAVSRMMRLNIPPIAALVDADRRDKPANPWTACERCGMEYPSDAVDRWHLVEIGGETVQVCSACKVEMESHGDMKGAKE